MADIIAIKIVKGKPVKQRFSEQGWKLLGVDKNGWTETDPQNIENTIETQKKLSSGKDQVIDNSIIRPKKVAEAVVSNTVTEPESVKENDVDDSVKSEFLKSIEGFAKGTIKDFFDGLEPVVKYDNKSSLKDLKIQLAEHFNYNIVELQKAFA